MEVYTQQSSTEEGEPSRRQEQVEFSRVNPLEEGCTVNWKIFNLKKLCENILC